ncbi:hypothetical protein M514_14119 [Trichuris suis]|uniref:Uncharacterized protein n=1 Tax=Trichuris suis TaxID=68888 RepID=A0A085LJ58_9BILA|nr:hypothetical protein M513_14119 [Trichuris suis]KFD59364.1 hypothetical protein M514_14119 [Trichuris suis]
MKCLKWYNNAKCALQNGPLITTRGRPPKINPQVAMEKALKASAVAECIDHCNNNFQAKILSYESNLRLRKIKEALYIRYNTTYNRDLGEDVSIIWSKLTSLTIPLSHSLCHIQNMELDGLYNWNYENNNWIKKMNVMKLQALKK